MSEERTEFTARNFGQMAYELNVTRTTVLAAFALIAENDDDEPLDDWEIHPEDHEERLCEMWRDKDHMFHREFPKWVHYTTQFTQEELLAACIKMAAVKGLPIKFHLKDSFVHPGEQDVFWTTRTAPNVYHCWRHEGSAQDELSKRNGQVVFSKADILDFIERDYNRYVKGVDMYTKKHPFRAKKMRNANML